MSLYDPNIIWFLLYYLKLYYTLISKFYQPNPILYKSTYKSLKNVSESGWFFRVELLIVTVNRWENRKFPRRTWLKRKNNNGFG